MFEFIRPFSTYKKFVPSFKAFKIRYPQIFSISFPSIANIQGTLDSSQFIVFGYKFCQGEILEFSEIDTTAMIVNDGLESVGGSVKADCLLFHTDLKVQGTTVYLSVSTAPVGRETVPT